MSSEIEGAAVVAAAVAVAAPAAATAVVAVAAVAAVSTAALGAGWLAWQGGKAMVEMNNAASRVIDEKKRELEQAELQKKLMAVSAHEQLVKICSQAIVQLENDIAVGNSDVGELKQLKAELENIRSETLPDDRGKIERINALGYLKIEEVMKKREVFGKLKIVEEGAQKNITVAELMNDMRIMFESVSFSDRKGKNFAVSDPAVKERAELNEKLANVTGRIIFGLEFVDDLTRNYGVSAANLVWFTRCFNEIDKQIEELCSPSVSNKKLKEGIKRLEDNMHMFDMVYPSIADDVEKIKVLYPIYAEAAMALGEEVCDIKSFGSSDEIENKLKYLEDRSKRAQECAQIYATLGHSAYMCYAWDTELREMGYSVYAREKIIDLIESEPEYGKIGEIPLPFYELTEQELTQLYSIAEDCNMQLIVNDDGSVSMKTFAEDNAAMDKIKDVQKKHCQQMKQLYENLRKNWFIIYDFKEEQDSDAVTSTAEWKDDESNELTTHHHKAAAKKGHDGKGKTMTII